MFVTDGWDGARGPVNSADVKQNSLPFLVARWIDRHVGLLKSAAIERQLRRR
jgi:hypothetical protein